MLLLAVVAFQCTDLLVYDMKEGVHGFVVGNTFGVAAAYDAMQLVRSNHLFLLNNVKITYDVEHYVGGYHREATDLFVGEEFVGYLDDSFSLSSSSSVAMVNTNSEGM